MANKLGQHFNLHSHTARCGHASGADEDYVREAILAGFDVLGFSDHIFLPRLSQPGMRGDYDELDDYLHSIETLQKKYEGKIKIYKAFEAEWLDKRFEPYYRELLETGTVDYLIIGQHCYFDHGFHWYGSSPYPTEATKAYLEDLLEGMRSGLFLYVAHPDLFMQWHKVFDAQAYQVAEAIAKLSKEMDIPLEVNMGPSRWWHGGNIDKRLLPYPNHQFWEVVARIGSPCVIGVDAHDPRDYRTSDYEFFRTFVEELGLKMVDPSLKLKK